ncbi:hypothetical protein TNCV_3488981 [Trichonephila clavipes]|nr:hypothetical protein TNCV_3488981 [Trichonephila clavipes]
MLTEAYGNETLFRAHVIEGRKRFPRRKVSVEADESDGPQGEKRPDFGSDGWLLRQDNVPLARPCLSNSF